MVTKQINKHAEIEPLYQQQTADITNITKS
jgi:hypothetical protein